MARGKGGKSVTKTLKDRNISDMFNQMIGAGGVNMNVVYPKYVEMCKITSQLVKLLKAFNDGVLMKKSEETQKAREEIATFITLCEGEQKEIFGFDDLGRYQGMFDMVADETRDRFNATYDKVKDSKMVKTFIMVCDKLVEYKRHIEDPKKLSYKFINTMAGVEFCPLPFTSLNFKYLFSLDSIDTRGKDYLLLILNKLYLYTYQLYHVYSKPDIDVNEFVEVILSNMSEVQKRIPRCGKAFRKIKESVELLKGNFSGYYRDFVQTKNSSIIMEHFVLDVSKQTDADPETTQQFRKIINYYRKMTQGKIKDERVNYLFKKVDQSFRDMENYSNIQKDKKGDDGDDGDDGGDDGGDDCDESNSGSEGENNGGDGGGDGESGGDDNGSDSDNPPAVPINSPTSDAPTTPNDSN
jgi:hypothetical protein